MLFTAAAEEKSKMKNAGGASTRKFKVFSDPVDAEGSVNPPKLKRPGPTTESRKSNLDKAFKRAPRVSCL